MSDEPELGYQYAVELTAIVDVTAAPDHQDLKEILVVNVMDLLDVAAPFGRDSAVTSVELLEVQDLMTGAAVPDARVGWIQPRAVTCPTCGVSVICPCCGWQPGELPVVRAGRRCPGCGFTDGKGPYHA